MEELSTVGLAAADERKVALTPLKNTTRPRRRLRG